MCLFRSLSYFRFGMGTNPLGQHFCRIGFLYVSPIRRKYGYYKSGLDTDFGLCGLIETLNR